MAPLSVPLIDLFCNSIKNPIIILCVSENQLPATLLPLEKVKQQNTPKQQQNEVVESAATDQTATEQSPQGSIKTLVEFHSVLWRNSIDFLQPDEHTQTFLW